MGLQQFDLTDRVAVVTAVPEGLGAGSARALGLAGATVMIASNDSELGEYVAAKLRADDVEAAFVWADLSDPVHIDSALQTTINYFGRVDILVNASEVSVPAAALDVSAVDWHRVIAGNLDTVWAWSQAFGRAFVAQGGGVIVNIGSMAATIAGRPHWNPALGASKAAVHHLTRSLAAEWAPYGVRVNALAPGYVAADGSATEDPRIRRHVLEDTPMERIGTVEEITPAVVFLASDASSFITGTVLVADGGYSTC